MKVLLFTHAEDIDGIGCAILAKQVFRDCEVIPTKTFEFNKNVGKVIESGLIEKFDKVYVTDLCIKEPLLGEIDRNPILRDKIRVIDHHKSEIVEGNDKYDFVTITVEKNGRKESGTSLFYQFLIDNYGLQSIPILDELVEWTRQYDVYDWVKINNQDARKLHILFEMLGYDKYYELINAKLKSDNSITFTDYEEEVIATYFRNFNNDMNFILSNMVVVPIIIDDIIYRIGYVICPYKYRNDINDYIRSKGNMQNIDIVGMIMTDRDTVSYRQINNVDVSKVAVYFGGKGHFAASSNPKENLEFKRMLVKHKIY